MMHLSGLTYLCEQRAEECGKSRFKMSFDEAKKNHPIVHVFFFHGSTDYQPLLFCSGAIVSFT